MNKTSKVLVVKTSWYKFTQNWTEILKNVQCTSYGCTHIYSYVKKLCNLRFSWEKLVFLHEEREIQVQNWKVLALYWKCILLHQWMTESIFFTLGQNQRYIHRVLQTIQTKLILLWVWAERAVLGRAKIALKFKYEIQIG